MRVWIDFSNSPHPLLFAPIARRLGELGHTVLVTARDNAQTLELARERWPDVDAVGTETPRRRGTKGAAITRRARELHRWARAHRLDVALSHNSYAQIVAARLARLRVITAMDYEHQPANHVAFRLAERILLPEALPVERVRRQGATGRKVRLYPGLKEELYVGDFEPDPAVLARLGIERDGRDAVVVMRAPPSRAMYHQFENPLYEHVLQRVAREPSAACVVLTRHAEQRAALAARSLSNVVVPTSAVDARSLMYAADLVVGAGGTMTREAAVMGVPTVSVYAGRPPAVDRWLEARGRLRRVGTIEDLPPIAPRSHPPRSVEELRERGRALTEVFVGSALA